MRLALAQFLCIPFFFIHSAFAQPHHAATRNTRGWLGVSVRDLTPRLAKEKGLKTDHGALVNDVLDRGPADKAGVKREDVILAFNGRQIEDADDLVDAVRDALPGSAATLEVNRDGVNKSLEVAVGSTHDRPFARPLPPLPMGHPDMAFFGEASLYGLHLMGLNPQLAQYFGSPGGKGVLVKEVDEKSPAEKAGFEAGDIILSIDSQDVERTRDVVEALEHREPGDTVGVGLFRKGERLTVPLAMEEEDSGWRSGVEAPWGFHGGLHLNLDHLKIKVQTLARSIRHEMEHFRQALRNEFRAIWS